MPLGKCFHLFERFVTDMMFDPLGIHSGDGWADTQRDEKRKDDRVSPFRFIRQFEAGHC